MTGKGVAQGSILQPEMHMLDVDGEMVGTRRGVWGVMPNRDGANMGWF